MNQPRDEERRGRRSSRSRRASRRAPSAPRLFADRPRSAPKRRCSSAYREGRLAHAWLIGGPGGDRQGDARLAVRPLRARQSRPGARRRCARRANLHVEPNHPAARLLAALAHPDFALIRREWQRRRQKRLATEISRRSRAAGTARCSSSPPPSAAGGSRSSTPPRT